MARGENLAGGGIDFVEVRRADETLDHRDVRSVRRIQGKAFREDLEQAGVVGGGMLEHRGVRLQEDVNGGHATGLESQGQSGGFRLAIAGRWDAFGAECREFGLGRRQIRCEMWDRRAAAPRWPRP